MADLTALTASILLVASLYGILKFTIAPSEKLAKNFWYASVYATRQIGTSLYHFLFLGPKVKSGC